MNHAQHDPVTAAPSLDRSRSLRQRSSIRVACAGAIAATALLAAACGSSSTAPGAAGEGVQAAVAPTGSVVQSTATISHLPASTVHERTATDRGTRESVVDRRAQRAPDEDYAPPRITKGKVLQHPVHGTGGNSVNDDNPGAKGSFADSGRPSTNGEPDPCTLVSAARAEAITGRSVKLTEAPLGPTCIYQLSGARNPVTVAVERLRFSTVQKHIKWLSKSKVSGQTAYCGKYGSTVTYVPLSGQRVLDISASCQIGAKFAAVAVPALGY